MGPTFIGVPCIREMISSPIIDRKKMEYSSSIGCPSLNHSDIVSFLLSSSYTALVFPKHTVLHVFERKCCWINLLSSAFPLLFHSSTDSQTLNFLSRSCFYVENLPIFVRHGRRCRISASCKTHYWAVMYKRNFVLFWHRFRTSTTILSLYLDEVY